MLAQHFENRLSRADRDIVRDDACSPQQHAMRSHLFEAPETDALSRFNSCMFSHSLSQFSRPVSILTSIALLVFSTLDPDTAPQASISSPLPLLHPRLTTPRVAKLQLLRSPLVLQLSWPRWMHGMHGIYLTFLFEICFGPP